MKNFFLALSLVAVGCSSKSVGSDAGGPGGQSAIQACGVGNSCAEGQFCRSGSCQTLCRSNADCTPGQACGAQGSCVAASGSGAGPALVSVAKRGTLGVLVGTGQNLASVTAARLLDNTLTSVGNLIVSRADAQTVELALPADVQNKMKPSNRYYVQVSAPEGVATRDVNTLKGDPGPQGPVGPQGPKGDTGPIGLPGLTGTTGVKGDRGDKGDKGDKGDRGDRGSDGSNATVTAGPGIEVNAGRVSWKPNPYKITNSFTSNGSSYTTAYATCNAGDRLILGGCFGGGSPLTDSFAYPAYDDIPTGWECSSSKSGVTNLTAYAFCIKL